MKIFLIVLAFVDFGVGILFGNIGHFFSVLCFPLLAILRGYLGTRYGTKNIRQSMFLTIIGGCLFFAGMIIGVIMLSSRVPSGAGNELMGSTAVGQALIMSIVSAFVYLILYILFGTLTGYLCEEIESMGKLEKKTQKEV